MKKFELGDKEYLCAERFKRNQKKKNSDIPTLGERWTYLITPTGIGTVVKIKDELLGDIKDCTDWDLW